MLMDKWQINSLANHKCHYIIIIEKLNELHLLGNEYIISKIGANEFIEGHAVVV